MMTRCDTCLRKGSYAYQDGEKMLWLCKVCVDTADFAEEWAKRNTWDIFKGRITDED